MGMIYRYYHLFVLGVILTSCCGYQWGQGTLPDQYRTITVPYVEGDKTGEMTSILVKEISRSGAFRYQRNCADLTLMVTLLEFSDENIGFRYDRNKKDKLTDSLIPAETRITVLAEVSVIDTCKCCAVLGPARIYAIADFDHDYYFVQDAVNQFSLGQVTDYDEAYDSVLRPLFHTLSEKIVDYVVHSW